MLGWLEDIWHAVKDLAYVLVGLLVELINALIAAIAALAVLLLSLLPGFPDPPTAPSGVIGALFWVVPIGSILGFFMLMVSCWISFLAIKVGLRWVKAL
jgi:uncharacterized membrane protein YdjX (TVP38/TMEM64 family)